MKFTIIGRKIEVSEKVKDYFEKKLSKLDKFFKSESEARVVLGTIKDNEYIEASIYAGGMIYRAEVSDADIFTAIDKIVDVIERQIRKNKTRMSKRVKEEPIGFDLSFEDYRDEDETSIVKRKEIEMKPMSEEEAILQMELLGHEFFAYKNEETGDVNILYKRKDGDYGILEIK